MLFECGKIFIKLREINPSIPETHSFMWPNISPESCACAISFSQKHLWETHEGKI